MTPRGEISQIQDRLSVASEEVDQANTIFNYTFWVLAGFEGFGDQKWDYRFGALANVSNIISSTPAGAPEKEGVIAKAAQEIAFRRLPRLLCVWLVSIVETALEDIAVITLLAREQSSEDEARRTVRKLMVGPPSEYLRKLASEFGFSNLVDDSWNVYRELAATRNVLVHRSEPVADARYVRNAGPECRAAVGEVLDVDNAYLMRMCMHTKVSLLNLLATISGNKPPF